MHQVRKNDALSVREVVYFALDIACGLSYLHPRIVHRDLKVRTLAAFDVVCGALLPCPVAPCMLTHEPPSYTAGRLHPCSPPTCC